MHSSRCTDVSTLIDGFETEPLREIYTGGRIKDEICLLPALKDSAARNKEAIASARVVPSGLPLKNLHAALLSSRRCAGFAVMAEDIRGIKKSGLRRPSTKDLRPLSIPRISGRSASLTRARALDRRGELIALVK